MKWHNFKIKLNGEDITSSIAEFHLEQKVANHHFFILSVSIDDTSSLFKDALKTYSEKWLGQKLELEDKFEGIVTSVSLSRISTGGSDLIIKGNSYSVLLDDGINYKSFGLKNLSKIIDEVLSPYEGHLDLKIKPAFKEEIKYCVQYAESNFDFLCRLGARFGEWFYFDGQILYFGRPENMIETRLDFLTDLHSFDISIQAMPVNFKIQAYDYKDHKFPEKSSEYSSPTNQFLKIALDKSKSEIFNQSNMVPINITMNEKDLDQIKKLKQDMNITKLAMASGTSTNIDLRIGMTIEVVDSREGLLFGGVENYGKYVITKLSHSVSANGDNYVNQFEAYPVEVTVPPIYSSPDPPPCEVQIAEVVDNNDGKSMGRVRIQFNWQKARKGDDAKTPWIRVATPMGGADKGFYMIPEIGDQVLVGFEQNHPERPYVLSSGMYHGSSKPEFFDSKNYKKTIKTKGSNQIVMIDEKDKESMSLSTPKDFSSSAVNGKMDLTAKETITIRSNNEEIIIDAPKKIIIHAKEIEINADASVKINGKTIEINADMSLSAKSKIINVEGVTTDVIGSGKMNVESSGITSISGPMLKLN